jgi:hypothetical protein
MSFADACIVWMAEIYERHAVLTLDSYFSVYRKHGRVPLALITPAGGVDDRGHQLRASRLWARKLKAVRNGQAAYPHLYL